MNHTLTSLYREGVSLETEQSMFHNKKAAIFDLDGTLADSMWVWEDIDKRFFASRGIPVPDTLQQEIEGMSFTETATYFVKTYSLPETVEELKVIWNKMAYDSYENRIKLKPGAKELLLKLHEKGILLGIATSNSRLLAEHFLESNGLNEIFSALSTSCEVAAGKPAPDVYLHAARELSVDPKDCLVFEDLPKGIQAGHNAGMEVCAIEDAYSAHQRQQKKEMAEYFIDDYHEVLDLL